MKMYTWQHLTSLITAALYVLMIHPTAHAACPGCRPPDPVVTCGMDGCHATIAGPAIPLPQLTFTNSAPGQFLVTQWDEAAHITYLQPLSWTASTQTELGTVTWNIDATRAVQNSTIASNQGEGGFPATGDLYFYINGTIDAQPGVTYQSQTPLHLVDADVNAFAPFNGEVFVLAAPVDFEDASNPGQVAFTLSNLTLTFSSSELGAL